MADVHTDVDGLLGRLNPVRRGDVERTEAPGVLEAIVRARTENLSAGVGRGRLRAHPRRTLALVGAVLLLVFPTLALSGALDPLFTFSTAGDPVNPASLDRESLDALSHLKINADTVTIVATHGETVLYAARVETGGLCVGSGSRGSELPAISMLSCAKSGSESFPSPRVPVLEAGNAFGTVGSDDLVLPMLIGFAADGVSAVAVRGEAGVLARAEVAGNVFAADVPPQPVRSIEAYDADGKVIWSRPYVSGGS